MAAPRGDATHHRHQRQQPLRYSSTSQTGTVVLGIAIGSGAATGAAIATALAVVALISRRATSGLSLLMIPAVAMLVVGQLWMIAVLRAQYTLPRKDRPRLSKIRGLFGGDLPLGVVLAIAAVAFAGMLMWTSAALTVGDGHTDGQDAAASQRMHAGMLAFFYAAHTGTALGALPSGRYPSTRQQEGPPPPP